MADGSNSVAPYPRLETATVAAFQAWLAIATPGSRIVYWQGCLAEDTFDDPDVGLRDVEKRRQLAALARVAMFTMKEGRVRLFQKRAPFDAFYYIAEAPPAPAVPGTASMARLPAGATEGSSAGRSSNGRKE